MLAAGCEQAIEGLDLSASASMLTGPLLRLGYYWRVVRRLQRAIGRIRPDIHIPVDSPALNWHLARAAKRCGSKVCYYIAPQVWAWAPWRVRKMQALLDHVACILPFEQEWLRQRGVPATYVGHPLFEQLPPTSQAPPDLLDAYCDGSWSVALLPGSRPAEILRHSPALTATGTAIRRRYSRAKCTFAVSDASSADMLRSSVPESDLDGLEIAVGRTHEVLSESHFAVAVSGTITLELAHFGVPMLVFYRVGRASYNLLGRWLVRTPRLSLVNILAGKKLVPELMPWHGRTSDLTGMALEVMEDLGWMIDTRDTLSKLLDPMKLPAPQTASSNAAELIANML
jgi:lipid-A-disaccharide synthase